MITFSHKPKQSIVLIGIISILLLLFLFSLTGSSPFLHLVGLSKLNGTIFFASRMLYWVCLVLVWLYSTKVEKQNLLIWKERKYKFLTSLASVIAIYLILFAGNIVIEKLLSLISVSNKSAKLSEIINILRGNTFLLLFTCVTAGVVEELIFRGYLLPRLEIIFKSPSLAIIISSLIFGLLHYKYGTILNIAGPFFIGLVFAYYYWKYRSIKILIIFHFLWDLISLLISVSSH